MCFLKNGDGAFRFSLIKKYVHAEQGEKFVQFRIKLAGSVDIMLLNEFCIVSVTLSHQFDCLFHFSAVLYFFSKAATTYMFRVQPFFLYPTAIALHCCLQPFQSVAVKLRIVVGNNTQFR